ncbi:MAG: DUF2934 domain-containing protein [Terrimicrobiaceae bacterium]|nr:DUF2934 domain-containing protein [Terrimicrobiaceae bacterium]
MNSREQKIAEIARRIYEEEGRPEGRAAEHWARAEKMVDENWDGSISDTPPPEASGEDFR